MPRSRAPKDYPRPRRQQEHLGLEGETPQDPQFLDTTAVYPQSRAVFFPDRPQTASQGWTHPLSNTDFEPFGPFAPDPSRVRQGLEIAQRVWMTMPHRPGIQILGQLEAGPTVISTGEAESIHRPVRETRVPMPPTPQPVATMIPSVSFTEGAQAQHHRPTGRATVPPTRAATSTALPTMAGSESITPDDTPVRKVTLTKALRYRVLEEAKECVYSLLLSKEGVPSAEVKEKFVREAVTAALHTVCGDASVEGLKLNDSLTTAMANVRHAFKNYASCCIQRSFGLRLPLDIDETEHKRLSVRRLLSELQYMKTQIDPHTGNLTEIREWFTTDLFTDILVDVLFLKKPQWYQYIKNDDLDQAFGLAGAAIGASLREFSEGTFREHSVAVENWRHDFVEVMEVVKGMRADEVAEQCAKLTELQRQIVVKGKSLRPVTD
ncbi:hypothetical protein JVU11DRAFT_938 [Chiua virens]|nr:hypothetical protein JVU11DRAFT_938 [Chiua virens]